MPSSYLGIYMALVIAGFLCYLLNSLVYVLFYFVRV
jgi:hypothetical protein